MRLKHWSAFLDGLGQVVCGAEKLFPILIISYVYNSLQKVMLEVEKNGWKKVDDKSDIKEEEIRNLFNMIDKDKSGSLSVRVNRNIYFSLSGKLYIFTEAIIL